MNPLSRDLCAYLNVHPQQVTEEGFVITGYTTNHVIIEWQGRVHMTIREFKELVEGMEL